MGNLLHALQIQKVQIKHIYACTVHPKTLLLLYVIYMIITCRIGCINPHPKKRLVDSTSYHRIIIKWMPVNLVTRFQITFKKRKKKKLYQTIPDPSLYYTDSNTSTILWDICSVTTTFIYLIIFIKHFHLGKDDKQYNFTWEKKYATLTEWFRTMDVKAISHPWASHVWGFLANLVALIPRFNCYPKIISSHPRVANGWFILFFSRNT